MYNAASETNNKMYINNKSGHKIEQLFRQSLTHRQRIPLQGFLTFDICK